MDQKRLLFLQMSNGVSFTPGLATSLAGHVAGHVASHVAGHVAGGWKTVLGVHSIICWWRQE